MWSGGQVVVWWCGGVETRHALSVVVVPQKITSPGKREQIPLSKCNILIGQINT
jgi:hypothetical protein